MYFNEERFKNFTNQEVVSIITEYNKSEEGYKKPIQISESELMIKYTPLKSKDEIKLSIINDREKIRHIIQTPMEQYTELANVKGIKPAGYNEYGVYF